MTTHQPRDDGVPFFFQNGTAKGVVLFDLNITSYVSEDVTTIHFHSASPITSDHLFLMLPLDVQMAEAVASTAGKRGWGRLSCSAIDPSALFTNDLAEHISALGSERRVQNTKQYAALIYTAPISSRPF